MRRGGRNQRFDCIFKGNRKYKIEKFINEPLMSDKDPEFITNILVLALFSHCN